MLRFRRIRFIAALSALGSLSACADSPVASPQLLSNFRLTTVNGQTLPVALNDSTQLVTGSLSISPDGTGTLFYAVLPAPQPGAGLSIGDPAPFICEFHWHAILPAALKLDCSAAGLGELVVVRVADGSVALRNLGETWQFTAD